MKIDDVSKNINRLPNIETSVNKNIESELKSSGSGSEKTDLSGEKVDLSSTSIEFSKAAESMDRISKDRIQRIEEIKLQVDNGTYDISGDKIAEAILKDILSSV